MFHITFALFAVARLPLARLSSAAFVVAKTFPFENSLTHLFLFRITKLQRFLFLWLAAMPHATKWAQHALRLKLWLHTCNLCFNLCFNLFQVSHWGKWVNCIIATSIFCKSKLWIRAQLQRSKTEINFLGRSISW